MTKEKNGKSSSNSKAKNKSPERSLSEIFPSLHERVEMLMKERHVSWSQLATKTGLSRPTLYRLGRGEGNPLLSNFALLADCLETTVAYLLGPQACNGPKHRNVKAIYQALLAYPPKGDPRARDIYEAVCRVPGREQLEKQLYSLNYPNPGENISSAIQRAILDVYDHQMHCIDPARLENDGETALKIQRKFKMPDRPELSLQVPVRVIQLPRRLEHVVQIHALAVVAAELIKELLQKYRILGFSDGFAVSTIQRFLRRGDLAKADLVPLTHSPEFVQFELSGPALIGAMARTHLGYQVSSTQELLSLPQRVRQVQVAVTSCGPIDPESQGRLARLMHASVNQEQTYEDLIAKLKKQGVVGDIMYHFLQRNGRVYPQNDTSRSLESINPEKLYDTPDFKDAPPIYSVSPDGLRDIARRGVCLLVVHTASRAAVTRAALLRKSVNLIVITGEAADRLLKL
jgi:DNA-binding transcriptional regulator LsrR (DeoR family)/transcriptional regulator with XRE-family HTH domain